MEQTTNAFTYTFENIFSNYDEWKEYFELTEIIDYNNMDDALFDKYCYNILARHFTHQNIRYLEIDAFLLELTNVYQSKFYQFKRQKEMLDKMYSLTDNDLLELEQYINNVANNPNDDIQDPKKVLNFVSAQTYSQKIGNKLEQYLKALNDIPSLSIYKFINDAEYGALSFKDLFMNVQPRKYFEF